MTGRWRRHLTQGSEVYLRTDWDTVWNLTTHFEPLLLYICLPYRSECPRLAEQQQFLDDFQRTMLRPKMQNFSDKHQGVLLRKSLFRPFGRSVARPNIRVTFGVTRDSIPLPLVTLLGVDPALSH
jgi:hypothetical protein